MTTRTATYDRKTNETLISVTVALDGTGQSRVATGIGFFDHMLDQLSRHSLIDLTVEVEGDLHIDAHHTVEDTGIVLGHALARALGDKAGIQRYGNALLPMDDALCRAAVDLSGRPWLHWNVAFTQPALGSMDTEVFKEFFQALANGAGANIHIDILHGVNNHHMIEAAFKACARALRAAVEIDPRRPSGLATTKGRLADTPDGSTA
ncbi:imidazoleglycerol-phosphate dehydratase HisB [Fodinicurvata sp. EGI_FJ10296]|uniref:imidazoleglycerol-phosphate dehydratase HisB n=1 Tax=Fodinicurvata sp. EGI_FJ10296 TaxID=3231908 RepID=UPI003453D224